MSQPHSASHRQTHSGGHKRPAAALEEPPIYLRYLHNEVSSGLALLDLAQTIHALPVASQCRLHAQQSHDAVRRFLEQVPLSDTERTELVEKLAPLAARLTESDA